MRCWYQVQNKSCPGISSILRKTNNFNALGKLYNALGGVGDAKWEANLAVMSHLFLDETVSLAGDALWPS